MAMLMQAIAPDQYKVFTRPIDVHMCRTLGSAGQKTSFFSSAMEVKEFESASRYTDPSKVQTYGYNMATEQGVPECAMNLAANCRFVAGFESERADLPAVRFVVVYPDGSREVLCYDVKKLVENHILTAPRDVMPQGTSIAVGGPSVNEKERIWLPIEGDGRYPKPYTSVPYRKKPLYINNHQMARIRRLYLDFVTHTANNALARRWADPRNRLSTDATQSDLIEQQQVYNASLDLVVMLRTAMEKSGVQDAMQALINKHFFGALISEFPNTDWSKSSMLDTGIFDSQMYRMAKRFGPVVMQYYESLRSNEGQRGNIRLNPCVLVIKALQRLLLWAPSSEIEELQYNKLLGREDCGRESNPLMEGVVSALGGAAGAYGEQQAWQGVGVNAPAAAVLSASGPAYQPRSEGEE